MAPNWNAYHGLSGSEHEAKAEALSAQGFRMTCVCAYGDSDHPVYAAIWTQTSGPKWVHCYGLRGSEYQSFFNEWNPKGYQPIVVSAATYPQRRFAAVLELNSTPTLAKHNIDQGEFVSTNQWAHEKGFILRWMSRDLFWNAKIAAIWVKNYANLDWFDFGPDPASVFQTNYQNLVAGGNGLAFVTVTHDRTFPSIWHRNSPQLNTKYKTHHNMSPAGYQDMVEDLKAQGWYPTLVQAGYEGSDARFAAMFRK